MSVSHQNSLDLLMAVPPLFVLLRMAMLQWLTI